MDVMIVVTVHWCTKNTADLERAGGAIEGKRASGSFWAKLSVEWGCLRHTSEGHFLDITLQLSS